MERLWAPIERLAAVDAFSTYIQAVAPLGIVSELIISTVPDKPSILYNVFKKDFSKGSAEDQHYKELRELGSKLEEEFRFNGALTLFVSAVQPFKLDGFLEDCQKRNIKIVRIPILNT